MQTFLPYVSYQESAECLDSRRLGKQRVECLQILNCLLGFSNGGWRHHPAVKMWAGREAQLFAYGLVICAEWRKNGYKDTVQDKLLYLSADTGILPDYDSRPGWLNEDLCRSHRSNLIRKYPGWYRPLWPDVPDNVPYLWPAS